MNVFTRQNWIRIAHGMMRRIGSKYVGIASGALHIESPVPEYE